MRPSIVLGPGERLQPLAGVLSGLGWAVRPLHDWADLGPLELDSELRVLVDVDSTPQEDLGFLRRCLETKPSASVTALGEDAGTRVARTLLAMPRVRWMSWPPDLNDILALTERSATRRQEVPHAGEHEERVRARSERRESSGSVRSSARAPAQNVAHTLRKSAVPVPMGPPSREQDAPEEQSHGERYGAPAHFRNEPDEIEEIQSILAGEIDEPRVTIPSRTPAENARAVQARSATGTPATGTLDTSAMGATGMPASGASASALAPEALAPTGSAHPHENVPAWWRAQVADLADAAQRIELGAMAVRSEMLTPDAAEQVDALGNEIARLVQFARTLGYVAAPPGRGEQVFDLAEMVQVFVTELANRPDDAPRCLFRAPAHVWVRSDRRLLGQVFDALFWLAGSCARAGELVRAQVRREGDTAEARIEFPAGPLEGFELERIVEPYALRRVMPELGPNALSAAQGILSGQGGGVELERSGNGRLEWRLSLPAVEPSGSEAHDGEEGAVPAQSPPPAGSQPRSTDARETPGAKARRESAGGPIRPDRA